MHIAVVGLSHRTAPVEIRERLSIPEQSMEASLQQLRADEQVLEAFCYDQLYEEDEMPAGPVALA